MKTIVINEKEIPVFCTVQEADDYFATKLNSSVWDNLTTEQKPKALIEATRKLDNLKFAGFPVEPNQPLAFPRYFKPNYFSKDYLSAVNSKLVNGVELILVECPEELVNACCEEAVNIASMNNSSNSIHIQNQKMGITSASIMGDSVSYNGKGASCTGFAGDEICSEAYSFISKFLISVARVV